MSGKEGTVQREAVQGQETATGMQVSSKLKTQVPLGLSASLIGGSVYYYTCHYIWIINKSNARSKLTPFLFFGEILQKETFGTGTGTAAQSEAGKKGGERAKELGAGIMADPAAAGREGGKKGGRATKDDE